jgi:molybdopterin adenylyltransferase
VNRAAVVTVSDSSFEGRREDRSGPAVCARLTEAGFTTDLSVVPDESERIVSHLIKLADSALFDVIFTTGGTGIASRDVTPEATRCVIEREIPGFGEWMRISGRQSIHTAILSRGLAGSRGQVLIVNLPGSPKGSVESLNAVIDVVPHALDLLRGRTEH